MRLATGIVACVLTTAAVLTPTTTLAQTDGWTDLFNGSDLAGWVSGGDADAWGVVDGEIVTLNPGRGWWLRTDRMYRDFELELDFWMPEGGNSGLGLRGSSNGDPAFSGFEVQIYDSHGKDADIRSCGAVYEAIAPSSMEVNPAGQWSSYRVRLVGSALDVWLNGVQIQTAQQLDDRGFFRTQEQPLPLNTRATTGYISLQDHGQAFRFRNIRIKDLSPDPEPTGMVQLITPDLEGWFAEDLGEWASEGGTLVGRDGPGHLFTHTEYADFELRTLVKINGRGNSGIYFRVQPNPDPNTPWPNGYEAQVDQHDPKNFTGCVYNRAWPAYINSPITQDDAWFDYRIRVEGNWIRTWINGVPMVNTIQTDFDKGRFAVQGHNPGSVISFRDFRVLDLSDE